MGAKKRAGAYKRGYRGHAPLWVTPMHAREARTVRTRSEPESERKWARARLVVLLSVFITRLFADRTGAYLRVKGTVVPWVLIRR